METMIAKTAILCEKYLKAVNDFSTRDMSILSFWIISLLTITFLSIPMESTMSSVLSFDSYHSNKKKTKPSLNTRKLERISIIKFKDTEFAL